MPLCSIVQVTVYICCYFEFCGDLLYVVVAVNNGFMSLYITLLYLTMYLAVMACVLHRHGHIRAVTVLLNFERGCSPNVTNDDGSTPLHLAAEHGMVYVVELLLSHKEVDVVSCPTLVFVYWLQCLYSCMWIVASMWISFMTTFDKIVRQITEQPPLTLIKQKTYDAVWPLGKNRYIKRYQENSYHNSIFIQDSFILLLLSTEL